LGGFKRERHDSSNGQLDTSLNTVNSYLGNVVITAPAQPPPQNVTWTNVSSTIQVTGNSIEKVSGTSSWYDAGAVSSQTIAAGDGYMEFTPGDINTMRMCGLGNTDTSVYYADIEYAFFMSFSGDLHIYESGIDRGYNGVYAASDRLKVAVEGGVVKYYRNGSLVYTSTVAPQYPLQVDTSLNTVNSYLGNVVITASQIGNVNWLVTDQLGTPRMVVDQTGSLASVKRHDYLPFGEELVAGVGGRTSQQGYGGGDGVRQQFTQKERDNETGLDYFGARYYGSIMGRFTSADPLYYTASRPGDPQQFNLYAYVRNNPLALTDPDGKDLDVAGNEKYRKAVEAELLKLAPGTRVDAQGHVHKAGFFRRIANHLTGHGSGQALISRLVNSDQTTTIKNVGRSGSFTVPKDGAAADAVAKGQSADATVYFSLNTAASLPTRGPDAAGNITATSPIVDVPLNAADTLGHELIHALHIMEGTYDGTTVGNHDFVEGNIAYRESEKIEEFRTVGYAPYKRSGDITENQLRRELNINPRATYNYREKWTRLTP
jgi:RHS repeat-associated protein